MVVFVNKAVRRSRKYLVTYLKLENKPNYLHYANTFSSTVPVGLGTIKDTAEVYYG